MEWVLSIIRSGPSSPHWSCRQPKAATASCLKENQRPPWIITKRVVLSYQNSILMPTPNDHSEWKPYNNVVLRMVEGKLIRVTQTHLKASENAEGALGRMRR
jgi:hypothetical protein